MEDTQKMDKLPTRNNRQYASYKPALSMAKRTWRNAQPQKVWIYAKTEA